METQPPSLLTVDDLKAMPMREVFKLVKDIEGLCNQALKDVKVHSDNIKTINKFIDDLKIVFQDNLN